MTEFKRIPVCTPTFSSGFLVLILFICALWVPEYCFSQTQRTTEKIETLFENRFTQSLAEAPLLLAQWESIPVEDSATVGSVLSKAGYHLYWTFIQKREFDKLLPICESVIRRMRPFKDQFNTEWWTWHGRIAESYGYLKDPRRCLDTWASLQDTLLGQQPQDSIFIGEVYLQMAKQAYYQKWYEEGLISGEEGVKFLQAFNDADMYASLLLIIGRIYNQQADYLQAITHFRRAIDILETIPESTKDPAYLTLPYVEVAQVYNAQGKPGLGLEFYEKAQAIMAYPTVTYADQISILGNMVGLYRKEFPEKALRCASLALEKHEFAISSGELVPPNTLIILNIRKGRILYEMGNWEEADNILTQALEEASKREEHFPALFAANVLVTKSLTQNSPETALQWWQVGYRILQEDFSLDSSEWTKPLDPTVFTASTNIVSFLLYRSRALISLEESGKYPQLPLLALAEETALLGQDLLLEIRRNNQERSQGFNDTYQSLQGVRLDILSKQDAPETFDKMFQLMDRSKVIGLQEDWLYEQRKRNEELPVGFKNRLEQLEREVVELEAMIFDNELAGKKDTIAFQRAYRGKTVLVEKRRALGLLEDSVTSQFPAFALGDHNYPFISIEEVRSLLLPKEKAVVSFFYTPEYLFGCLLTSDTILINKWAVTDSFSFLLQEVITANRSPRFSQEMIWASNRLYTFLFADFEEVLASGISGLMIIPDGPLVDLPFEALVIDPNQQKRPEYLLDRFAVTYWLSARSRWLLEEKAGEHTLLSDGNLASFAPQYPAGGEELAMMMENDSVVSRLVRNGEFELPGAMKEATVIADMWNGQVYKGAGVTEEEFLKEAANFSILHLAMHALVEEEREDFSRLLFAPSSTDGRGFLSAMEISDMELPADLVVLSACNTGRGEWRAGEGVFHLGRAFRMAGVRSLVLSLWQVPDQATSQLMPRFYEGLKEGTLKSDALRKAKLAYLDHSDPMMSSPYFWAGFVLIGDDSALPPPESNYPLWITISLLGLLVLIGGIYLRRRLS